MPTVKYIRTKDNEIIIFGEIMQHKEFKEFDPISAGFISIGVKGGNPDCTCYGESISLHLKSIPDEDTKLARRQLGFDVY